MNDTVAISISIFVAFAFGASIWFIVLRGFIGKWLQAKSSGGILVLNFAKHGNEGKFFVAKPSKKFAGAYTYKGEDKTDKVIVPRGVTRVARIRLMMTLENDTSPLLPTKVHRVNIEYDKPTKKNLDIMAFTHHDDSSTIANLIIRALTRPKKSMSALSMKVILPVIIGIGAVIFIIMQMGGGV